MLSSCHKTELAEFPVWSGTEKIGYGYVCPKCNEIKYYRGQFLFSGWEVRSGTRGYGCYYKGKGIKKTSPKSIVNHIAPNHGLLRKDMLAQNAYQPDL